MTLSQSDPKPKPEPNPQSDAKSLNILCAGECMVELRSEGDVYHRGFAGDVINFGIYLKRLVPDATVNLLSAIGSDSLSHEMRAFLEQEGINTELVFTSPDKTVGLYMVHTDAAGERTFSYWRSDSAARHMLALSKNTPLDEMTGNTDYFYFSGITLAILDQPGREQLFALTEQYRRLGKTIIFDPNFRARLWPSHEQALAQIERCYGLCNILLSSVEDEQLLWGSSTKENTMKRLANYPIDEIILTNGPAEISAYDRGRQFQIQPIKAGKVVDTTSAGDAFNAGYIGARHAGYSTEESIEKASGLASVVIGLPGAIIPTSRMSGP